MAVPTRTEALALLLSASPTPSLFRHMTVVAEIASFLAYRATQAGVSVDRRMVETAALLHDLDKTLPREHPLRTLGHGAAGAAWVSRAGHPELARSLQAHPVMRLNDHGASAWVLDGPIEERIVTYADKRATQRVVSLEQRFARWRRRHPDYIDRLDRAYPVALELEAGVCAAAQVGPAQVERLRWVDDAVARGRANGSLPTNGGDGDAAPAVLAEPGVTAPLDPSAIA